MAPMATNQATPGTEQEERYTMIDEKKRKRMISNRDSARRSRMKREQHVKDLHDQVMHFEAKKNEMIRKIKEFTKLYNALDSENMTMRSQKQELTERLDRAETLASYVGEIGDLTLRRQDPWVKAQQHPLPIMSSAGFFKF